MGFLVGQDGVDFPIAQTRLVKAHVRTEILGIEQVFLRMGQLVPVTVTTDLLLVLLAQRLTVKPVAGGKSGDAYRSALNLLLLKKQRTQR